MADKGAPPTATPKPSSSSATLSLIAGILGITLFPVVGSIVAVVAGYAARREIHASEGALGGEGLATAGIILGWIGLGMIVLGLCGVGLLFGVPLCIGLLAAVGAEYGAVWPFMIAVL